MSTSMDIDKELDEIMVKLRGAQKAPTSIESWENAKQSLLQLLQDAQGEARIDENWLLIKQTHKVAAENGESLRKTKCSLEAIVYWARGRIKTLQHSKDSKGGER